VKTECQFTTRALPSNKLVSSRRLLKSKSKTMGKWRTARLVEASFKKNLILRETVSLLKLCHS